MKKAFASVILASLFFNLKAQKITWSEDIACIIYSHCSPCHNSEANSKFPLMSYNDVFNQRLAVELYVNTGKMPPAITNHNYSKFSGDRHLIQKEIDLIKEWARDLALEGNPNLAPPAPIYSKRSATISNPDISFITNYNLPDTIEHHLRRCFVIKPALNSTKRIHSIEVIPKDPSVVHSVFIYSDTSSYILQLDDEDPGKGYSKFYGAGSKTYKPVYAWTLDSKSFDLGSDFDLSIDSNSFFIVQVQYSEELAGLIDSTIVNISFDTALNAARQITMSRLLAHDKNLVNWPFIVQVGETKQFYERYTVGNDMSIFSISPVAHNYCDSMKVFATLPSNDTLHLLKIDNWDASWSEGIYNFKKPLYLPAGTVIHAFATYSNTVLNKHDPDDELEQLHGGVDDHDEEMIFYFSHLPYQTGDEKIYIDTLTHYKHHLDCNPLNTVSVIQNLKPIGSELFPNPANKFINVNTPYYPAVVSIYNGMGQLVISKNITDSSESIFDVSNIKAGFYFVNIASEKYFESKKLLVQPE